jgi:two-component system KDP operon response regulator KdpE
MINSGREKEHFGCGRRSTDYAGAQDNFIDARVQHSSCRGRTQALEETDLIITDLRMPNMDGLELCRKVRAQSHIPIIVPSVRGGETIKVKALGAGADDYVTKPFSVDELLARLRAALRRTSMLNSQKFL